MKPFDRILVSGQSKAPGAHRAIVNDCDIVLSVYCHTHTRIVSYAPVIQSITAKRPWPVRYQLRRVQSLLLRSKPCRLAYGGWRLAVHCRELVRYIRPICLELFFSGLVYSLVRTGHCRPYRMSGCLQSKLRWFQNVIKHW